MANPVRPPRLLSLRLRTPTALAVGYVLSSLTGLARTRKFSRGRLTYG